MTKELTDKMKGEIVESQINLIKENDKNGIINYESLKRYLTEGINEYFSGDGCLNEEVDYILMKQIEKEIGGKKFARLDFIIRCQNDFPSNNFKNKDLLNFYNKAEQSLKTRGFFRIRNYGHGCHGLLTAYLKAKALIKTPIVSG